MGLTSYELILVPSSYLRRPDSYIVDTPGRNRARIQSSDCPVSLRKVEYDSKNNVLIFILS